MAMLPRLLWIALWCATPLATCVRLTRRSMGQRALASLSVTPLTTTLPALAISATTMSGKTRPDTGVVLLDEPAQNARGKSLTATADLVSADGVAASVAFDSPWPLQRGNYYDVEVKSKEGGDGAFVLCKTPPRGVAPAQLQQEWFAANIFNIEGRYGAYGAPADVKVIRDETVGGDRFLEYAFTALSPSRAEVLRKCVVKATSAPGSKDIFLIVAGTTASRWKKEGGEATSRKVADSFRVVSSKKTSLKKEETSDYRFYKAKVSLSSSQSSGGAQYGGDL